MNTKRLMCFLILAVTLLITSIVLTVTVIIPNFSFKYGVKPIATYAFNVGSSNDSSIWKKSDSVYTFKKPMKFSPTKTQQWNESLVTFRGNTTSDEIELCSTQAFDYVFVLPFSIVNHKGEEINFSIEIKLNGASLAGFVDYKLYDFCDKQYKTLDEINSGFYAQTGARVSLIDANSSAEFCFVATINEGGASAIGDQVDINLVITVNP